MEVKPMTWIDVGYYSVKDLNLAFSEEIDIVGWNSYFAADELIGSMFVSDKNHVGVILTKEHRNQGWLEQFYKTIEQDVLFADIDPGNVISIKAHKKIGFELMPKSEVTYKLNKIKEQTK